MIPTHRLPGDRRYYVLKDELIEFIRAQPASPSAGDSPVALKSRRLEDHDSG